MFNAMDNDRFNRLYRELMENAQLVEERLGFIYTDLKNPDKPIWGNQNWFDDLWSVDHDAIGHLSKLIKDLESAGNRILDKAMYQRIDNFRKERNYWVHQCFIDGTWSKPQALDRLGKASREAFDLKEELFRLEQDFCKKNQLC